MRSWPLVVGTFRALSSTRRGGMLGRRALWFTRVWRRRLWRAGGPQEVSRHSTTGEAEGMQEPWRPGCVAAQGVADTPPNPRPGWPPTPCHHATLPPCVAYNCGLQLCPTLSGRVTARDPATSLASEVAGCEAATSLGDLRGDIHANASR